MPTKDHLAAAHAGGERLSLSVEQRYILINVHCIDRSKNYRATYDQVALEEMAASIKSVGVVHPIVVRSAPRSDDCRRGEAPLPYVLVAGERRVRASIMAGMVDIPAVVRDDVDDAGARVLGLTENLQRRDVDPLEEADGFRDLERHGLTVAEVAARVGRDSSYVRRRLALCDLVAEGRDAYAAGKIDAAGALEVARVPAAAQVQVMREVATWVMNDGEPARHADVRRLVRESVMMRLADASFDPDDHDLVPNAGACGPCPRRTGTQTDLFSDVGDSDTCTDPDCYRAKADATWSILEATATADGRVVIEGAAALQVFAHGSTVNARSGYVDAAQACWSHPQNLTYGEIVGPRVPRALARDSTGRVHNLIAVAHVTEALKGVVAAAEGKATAEREVAERDRDAARQRVATAAVIAHVVSAARDNDDLAVDELLAIIGDGGFDAAIRDVLKNHGESRRNEMPAKGWARLAASTGVAAKRAILLEVMLTRNAHLAVVGLPDHVARAAKRFGVRANRVQRAATAEHDRAVTERQEEKRTTKSRVRVGKSPSPPRGSKPGRGGGGK